MRNIPTPAKAEICIRKYLTRDIISCKAPDLPTKEYLEKVVRATRECLDRRDRKKHPDGYFDSKKRWYPMPWENQECCPSVRNPSATYPFSLMTHCRTVEHVAKLFKVDPKDIRHKIRDMKRELKEPINE